MSVAYYKGQQLGRDDLFIYPEDAEGHPINLYEITYALYDATTGQEVLLGFANRTPANPSVGLYYASLIIPLDANLGDYVIRWSMREMVGGPLNEAVMRFAVVDKATAQSSIFTPNETDMIQRLRILLRDNCVGGEEIVELNVGGERVLTRMDELWEALAGAAPESKVATAFTAGTLRVLSVSPAGECQWKRVLDVHKSDEVGAESIWEFATSNGPMVLTGGHRVFTTPNSKIDAEQLDVGQTVLGANGSLQIVAKRQLDPRNCMYDLTAEDWHNFVLYRSGVVVSNSPDRNYHFRPPAHEETVNQYTKVFGYIWEDAELKEYIERSLDMVSAAPPSTILRNVDDLVRNVPQWRTLVLNGAQMHALMAVILNWVADEFSLVGETLVKVRLPDGQEVDLPIKELYSICKGRA